MNHRELSTFSSTSSRVINCPMLRAVGAGGQTSCPWTLIFHCQTARRHLAKDTAASSVPMVKGMTHLAQGTSSSGMPWTTNWSQHVVLQVGSMVSRVSSSSPMSTWYSVPCPGLPLEIPAFPQLNIGGRHPPATLRDGQVYAGSGNHPPMPRPHPGRPGPSPHQSDWTVHRRGY